MEQRKIEGWIDGEPTQPPDPQTGFIASLMGSEANDGSSIPATLIIGGKGFTEEEVKAIIETVKLEAVASVNAMSNWHRGQRSQPPPPVAYLIDKVVEMKYGIQLP